MPGDLYRFLDTAPPATLKVNGARGAADDRQGLRPPRRARGSAGDTIELDLPMPVRRVVAHEKVTDDAGRVALQRGPIVYAAEWPDNPAAASATWCCRTRAALTREFMPDAAERRDGAAGTRARARRRQPRRRHLDRPAAHRDPLRDVGQPRAGRDDRLAAAHRRRRASDAVSDARHRRHDHGVGADRGPRQEHASDQRRRGAALVRRPVVVLRLVADARQRGRVGRDDVREAGDDLGSRRSTGSTTPATARCACRRRGGILYKDGAGWKPVEAVEGLRRRARSASTACRSSRSRPAPCGSR